MKTDTITIPAEPAPLTVDPAHTALVVIDMQRDFLEPGGFGASLGNDVQRLAAAIAPCAALLAAARAHGLFILHTREGHRPDLSDAPQVKLARGAPGTRIGADRADGAHPDSRRSRDTTSCRRCIRKRASR